MGYRDWNAAELARQLQALGFGQYCQEFQANEITGAHLPLLTEEHLREIGVRSIGHRILLQRRLADIVAGRAADAPAPIQGPAPRGAEPQAREAKKPAPPARSHAPVRLAAMDPPPAQRPIAPAGSDPGDGPPARERHRPGQGAAARLQPLCELGAAEDRKTTDDRSQNSNADNTVPCPYCRRKFTKEIAQRHLVVCGKYNAKLAKK
jgi:hypothetical protein